MSGRGRHRRQPNRRTMRGVSRLLIATAGSTGIALPLLGAGNAHAAGPADAASKAASKAAHSHASGQHHAKPGADSKSDSKSDSTSGSGLYKVAKDDTLTGIAREKKVEGGWHKLFDANRDVIGDDPSEIHPGEKLSLDTKGGDGGSKPQGGRSGEVKDAPDTKDSKSSTKSAEPSSSKQYPDNLDGWIREARDVMQKHDIPGSYEGIKRNIMRESGGNPNISNNWDSNAQQGTPSKGLLQVIQPTFEQYHVPGTANDSSDPVANIVAACNYAADKYGSMDNVNGAY